MTREDRRVLGAVFSVCLARGTATSGSVARRLGSGESETRSKLAKLVKSGQVRLAGGAYKLTPSGRKSITVVLIGGGFEVIHSGHLYTIEKARSLGDVLVVAVATDGTIRKRKKREPISTQEERAKLLSSLRQVDAAIVGSEKNIYETLVKVKPDMVALGYDQYHTEADIVNEAKERGIRLRVVRLDSPEPGLKTSTILSAY